MSFISSLIIFLSLCLHACTARHLPLIHKDLHKQFISAMMVKVVSFDSIRQEETNNGDNNSMIERSDDPGGANINPKSKDFDQKDMKFIKPENSGTSKLRSRQDKEEAINWSYNSAEERVAEMDYEPPHVKTPTHNK